MQIVLAAACMAIQITLLADCDLITCQKSTVFSVCVLIPNKARLRKEQQGQELASMRQAQKIKKGWQPRSLVGKA